MSCWRSSASHLRRHMFSSGMSCFSGRSQCKHWTWCAKQNTTNIFHTISWTSQCSEPLRPTLQVLHTHSRSENHWGFECYCENEFSRGLKKGEGFCLPASNHSLIFKQGIHLPKWPRWFALGISSVLIGNHMVTNHLHVIHWCKLPPERAQLHPQRRTKKRPEQGLNLWPQVTSPMLYQLSYQTCGYTTTVCAHWMKHLDSL